MRKKYLNINRFILLFNLFLGGFTALSAQPEEEAVCSGIKHFEIFEKQTYVKDPELEKYDVSYYKIDLLVNDTNTYLEGSTSIVFTSLEEIDVLVLELSSRMEVDSAFLNDLKITSLQHEDDLIKLMLTTALTPGEKAMVSVHYHGSGGNAGFFSGISSKIHGKWNQAVTYTLSESFHSKDWFVCKQVLTDKADSADIFLTVPGGLMAGSNGLLVGIDSLPGGLVRFRWHSSYPITYYLLSLAVSDYQDYSFYVHSPNSPDSLLIQNFIYDHPDFLPTFKEEIDETAKLISLFSELYSLYPFWNEKYGHSFAPLGGGMEHQTMTTLSGFSFGLVAHELGHQWFGDHVTCASWQDIWINEGFASYTEYLALEHLVSRQEADEWMVYAHDQARKEPEGSVYVPEEDATNEFRIFSGSLSYKKGASIIHMIRHELDHDSLFFSVLREFQSRFADSTASGEDFKNVLEELSDRDFDWFFDQWYYGEGYPEFQISWWQTADSLIIRSEQEGSSDKTPFFICRMDVRCFFEDGSDTLIAFRQTRPLETFLAPMDKTIIDLQIDPGNYILSNSAVTRKVVTFGRFSINPNPFGDELNIAFLSDNIEREILLTDMSGKLLDMVKSSSQFVTIDTYRLAQGIYLVNVNEGSESYSARIVKE